MLLPVLLLSVLGTEPVKLAAPGLQLVDFDQQLADLCLERFVTVLGADQTVRVTTAKDIQQALGMERQRALLGCSDDGARASCLAELAGGLGVDAILSGSIGKVGSSITITLRVVRAGDGADVASVSERVDSTDALQEWLDAEAPRMRARVLKAFGRDAPRSSAGFVRFVPGIVGLALVGGGAGSLVVAMGQASKLQMIAGGEVATSRQISDAASTGKLTQGLGLGLIAAGGVAIATSAVWLIVSGSSDSASAALVPLEQGAVLSFGGTW